MGCPNDSIANRYLNRLILQLPTNLCEDQANILEGNCQDMSLLERLLAIRVALVVMTESTLVVIIGGVGAPWIRGDSCRGSGPI